MPLIIRSKSSLWTSSPLTRASTGGSCAGTGLGGAGGVCGTLPAALSAGLAEPPPGAAAWAVPGAFLQAPRDSRAMAAHVTSFDLTDTSTLWGDGKDRL